MCALWTQNTDPSPGLPILWRWGTRWTDKLFCLRLLWLYLLALVYAHLYAYRILYHFILWLVLFLAFTFTFIGHLWDLFLYFCVLFFIFDSKILTYFLVELLYQTNMKFNVFNLGRISLIILLFLFFLFYLWIFHVSELLSNLLLYWSLLDLYWPTNAIIVKAKRLRL